MAFCINCGSELPDGAKFCMSCGTPNSAATASAPVPAPVQEPAPAPEKVYTFEEARGILAEKARNGFRAEVKGLLAKRHVEQLSDITDPKELAALVKEAEGIGIG